MSTTKQLLKSLKVSQAITPTAGAAGTTDIDGATIDMANFEGFIAEVTFGAIVTNAVTGITIEQSDASNMAAAETLTALTQVVADDDDGQTWVIDVAKPEKRYCRVHIDRATQNATVAAATYFQYGARTVANSTHGSLVNAVNGVSPVGA